MTCSDILDRVAFDLLVEVAVLRYRPLLSLQRADQFEVTRCATILGSRRTISDPQTVADGVTVIVYWWSLLGAQNAPRGLDEPRRRKL